MLSKRIKEARKMKNLTQEQLAALVGTKKATISNYENEHSTPSNKMLSSLANALNVTSDYLLGRVESPEGFIVDYTKRFFPNSLDESIDYFIKLLLEDSPFYESIKKELFESITEVLQNHDTDINFRIDLKKETNINEQLALNLINIDSITIKLELVEELKRIAYKYHLWFNEFYLSDSVDELDLDKLLNNSQLTYKGQKVTKKQLRLIKNYLDALFN